MQGFSCTFVCSFVFVFPNVTASAAGCSAELSGEEMQQWVCEGQPSAQAWDRITPLALLLITLPLVLYPTSHTLFSSPYLTLMLIHHPTSRILLSSLYLSYIHYIYVYYCHHPRLLDSSLVMVSPQSPFLYSPPSRTFSLCL